MGIYELAVTAAGLALGVGGAWQLPQLWRNERGWHPDRPPAYWAWGTAAWRGLVRLTPLSAPAFLALTPAYGLDAAGADGAVAEIVIAIGAAVGVVVVGLLAPAVFLFNRPKWAVVPHLRHQSGAIAEWRGRRSEPTPPPRLTVKLPADRL